METINSIGRRKAAVARVWITRGSGKIIVNKKEYKEYFKEKHLQLNLEMPLKALNAVGQYDINVNVAGGGIKGQTEAVRLGIARALVKENPENKPALKALKLMTRDPRVVERKKFGLKKARKAFQFSKR